MSSLLETLAVDGITQESHRETATSFVLGAAMLAGAAALTVPLLQSDYLSRTVLLDPKKLQSKRQHTYKHKWKQALDEARSTVRSRESLAIMAELVQQPEALNEFVKTHCLRTGTSPPRIVTIQRDKDDPRSKQEYYLYLLMNENSSENEEELYQVPLVDFGLALADAMDDQLTTTALCFMADASSNRGVDMLGTLLEETKIGVPVIREPLWMALLATIIEMQIYPSAKLQRVLFGLCRLDAWRVERQSTTATSPSKLVRTVAFTLPGQACVPALLPLLQAVFPCERHLFVYDGCLNSVLRALKPLPTPNRIDPYRFTSSVQITAPLTKVPLTKSIKALHDPLSKLPISMASTVETWMTSVDTFLRTKQDEATNEYLPFVLKLSLLVSDGSDLHRRLALANVLQFVTGSRSRPIPNETIDAAVELWRDMTTTSSEARPSISATHRKAIENCVFLHHGILIENKTLLDTVMPSKEWTLKAAKKISGCACCAPEEEEDEEVEDISSMQQESNNTAQTMRPAYVDGKMGFAFDPTKFS